MKNGLDHRVPLSDAALKILKALPSDDERVFPIRDKHMRRVLKQTVNPDATVHGMRASFKTWASEQTAFPVEIVEAALSHARGNDTSRRYDRGDLLEKWRKLMTAWAGFCMTPASGKADNVVRIGGTK